MNKKVLITGAGGFVGSALLDHLSTKDWQVLPCVRQKNDLPDEIVLDFCGPDAVQQIQKLPKVDMVVHLGARVDFTATPEELYAPNVDATKRFAEWAVRTKAHFIFASSIAVYDSQEHFITDKSVPRADTPYGRSKLAAEQEIKKTGVMHAILRIGGIYGGDGPDTLSINRSIRQAMSGDVPIRHCAGGIKRNYIFVKDLAETICFCMDHRTEGTYLVAGSQAYTMDEMLRAICDVFLPGSEVKDVGAKNGEDLIVELTGQLPKGRPFDEALRDIKYANRCFF